VQAQHAEGLISNPGKGRRIRVVTHAEVFGGPDIEEAGRRIARAVHATIRQAG
jgi:hypothetical protein